MLYIGLDVHSKWMTVRGFDPETGQEIEMNKLSNEIDSLDQYFGSLEGPLYGVMESGTNSWSVYRILESYFEKLYVVDPTEVWGKVIKRGAKTDRRDAIKLAMKMHRGELNPLYIPDVHTQDLRSLTRGKIAITRQITKTVNEIGALLRSWGIVLKCSLLSKQGESVLNECRSRLPDHSLAVLDCFLGALKKFQDAEAALEVRIKSAAEEDDVCRILTSIPGVGAFTALVVRAEIGDISRFRTPEQLISYCGLAPTVNQSSDNIYYGKLNRFANMFLKYVLVMRAQGMARAKQDHPMRQTYWRVLLRGKNHAKIAVARQFARVIFSMLKNNTMWDASRITSRRASPEVAKT